MRTAIVADSSCCLPAGLVHRYGIRVLPLALVIGGETIPDGALSPAELFARVDASAARPKSAAPAPGEFAAVFREALDGGADSVLCLTLSAAYSGTYASAVAGAEGVGPAVSVVDTGGLAMTHGYAVLAAARALEAGASPGEAAEIARRVGRSGRLFGALDTLRYLAKGGRVPRVLAWAAAALSIKPVLAFEDGRARAVARMRTREKALRRLVKLAWRSASGRRIRLAVMHTAAGDAARRLAEELSALHPEEMLFTEFTSVMSVHTGPGFVGIAVCDA